MMKEMKGVTFLHSETGTEGGWWAVQEDGFEDEDGGWSYDGLQILKERDDFTVYAKIGSMLWHGIIKRDSMTGAVPRPGRPSWKQQVVGGMWVHWIQRGMDPVAWGELFVGEKRCLVRREERAEQE
jgi:hypothetical protein